MYYIILAVPRKKCNREEDMIEEVRKFYNEQGYLPPVYEGRELQFEPNEIIKSWKIKES